MTHALIYLGKLVLDCLIAAAAIWTIAHTVIYLRGLLERRRWLVEPAGDPVDAMVWQVLDEARRITEKAARDRDT
jgi:hypothetical protein